MKIDVIRRTVLVAVLVTAALALGAPAAQAAPPPPTVTYSGSGEEPFDAEAFLHPVFAGTAQPYSVVRLYGNASCTGTSLGEGTTQYDGQWRATTTVQPGQTITVFANATDGTGTSTCSTTSKSWSVPPRPDTKITKKPAKVVKYDVDTHIDGIYVTFKFTSTTGGKEFRCTVDKQPIRCTGKKLKVMVKKGSHKFTVTAIDATYPGLMDKTPAKFKFTLKDK